MGRLNCQQDKVTRRVTELVRRKQSSPMLMVLAVQRDRCCMFMSAGLCKRLACMRCR